MKPKITVFTTTYCASCQTLKQWLESKNLDFEVVNLDDDPNQQQELLKETGWLQVPVTKIELDDDQPQYITGTQYEKIRQALKI